MITMAMEEQQETKEHPRWWKMFQEGDYFSQHPRRGDVLEANILAMSDRDILVDLGGKRDGVVQRQDLDNVDEDYVADLKVGDTIPVRVLKVPLAQSGIVVSLKQGLSQRDWLRAERLLETGEVISAQVTEVNKGGLLVEFGMLNGFVPNSHLSSLPRGLSKQDRRSRKEAMVGETLHLSVIESNPRRRRLILSERMAQSQRRKEVLEELHEGAIRTGMVRNIVDYGAFVDLGGVDGLVHVSEMAWDYVAHPRDIMKVGEEIEVYVLDVDRERERIALSRKRLLPDPWEWVTDNLHRNDVVSGTITNITDFGAFVEVGRGVEGLLYHSEIPEDKKDLIEAGTELDVRIVHIDPLQRQIGLRLPGEEDVETHPDE